MQPDLLALTEGDLHQAGAAVDASPAGRVATSTVRRIKRGSQGGRLMSQVEPVAWHRPSRSSGSGLCRQTEAPGCSRRECSPARVSPPVRYRKYAAELRSTTVATAPEYHHDAAIRCSTRRVAPHERLPLSGCSPRLSGYLNGGSAWVRCRAWTPWGGCANYSITSSAATRSLSGTVSPSALAVVRLIASSNFVDRSTGRSDGLTPLSRRPVCRPARRYASGMLFP